MSIFKAGVQYNDYTGTVAADRADDKSFATYLKDNGWCGADEVLVGIRFGFAGNYGLSMETLGVVAYLISPTPGDDPAPRKVRAVEVDIRAADLFMFFKRFDLVMTAKHLDLSQAEVDGPHYD